MSKRLTAIENFIPDGSVLVDVGTDHGLLIINAIKNRNVKFAYGIDINIKPLQACERNIEAAGYQDKVEMILGDGLKSFNKAADVFVLAGMGGETIYKIMEAYDFSLGQKVIIQANSKIIELRTSLNKQDFTIEEELFFYEGNVPVLIMVAIKDKAQMSESDFVIGPKLKHQNNASYISFLKERLAVLEEIKDYTAALQKEYKETKAFLQGGGV